MHRRRLAQLLSVFLFLASPVGGTAEEPAPSVAATPATAPPADADAPPRAAPEPGLEEVVVTATRRLESLQDVPVSVSVVTGDLLELSEENELSRLSKFVPSFRFGDSGNDVARSFSIRGVGTNTFSRGVEQSVGTSIDGVVSDSLATSLLDFGDVERIEVLKGPQGMLFGKNASAGLVKIETRRPTFDFEAGANASWADGNEIKVRGFLSGPILQNLAGRVSFFRTTLDGYIENLGGDDQNERDDWALRAKLLWEATPDLDVLLTYAHAERNPVCCAAPAVRVVPGSVADLAGTPVGRENDEVNNSALSENSTELDTYILNADWRLGALTVSSITAYSRSDSSADVRFLFPFPSETFLNPNRADWKISQITQELRLTSPRGQFLEWIGGFYFYDKSEEFDLNRNADLFFVGAAAAPETFGTSLINSVEYDNTQVALFGTATLNVTDRARLSAGIRWNYDDVSVDQLVAFNPNVFPTTVPESPPGMSSESKDDHGFSWRVTGQYDLTDDAMAFASAGQGYKGPGANTLPTGVQGIQPIIDPEIPTNFELGLKSEWWDRRLRINTSLFYTEFDDFQTAQTRVVPSTGLLGFFLANAGKLTTKGVEIDVAAQPLPNLTLNAAAAYIDAKFADYEGAPCYQGQSSSDGCVPNPAGGSSQDLSGVDLANSPDWGFTIGGHYGIPINDSIAAYLLGSYTWRDRMITGATGSPRTVVDAYGTMDLTLGFTSTDGRFSVQVFAKNLFDEFYETSAAPLDIIGLDRGHTLDYTYTRRIGVGVGFRF